ncbi:ArsC/Spx/MgsR family protein [Enterococcus sp. AZ109]|uniref:ArsC/Spx/MgsR family protein n=1 Tax=Enterococcus sp. AZ109 TaxID=2774634 RepID=UPI003F275299
MIQILSDPGCPNCRKVKKLLQMNNVNFESYNLQTEAIKQETLMTILKLVDDIDEILTVGSPIYNELELDYSKLTPEELLGVLRSFPDLINRPILFDGQHLCVGYNPEKLEALGVKADVF